MTQELANVLLIAVVAGIFIATLTVVNLMMLLGSLKLYTEMFKQIAQEKR